MAEAAGGAPRAPEAPAAGAPEQRAAAAAAAAVSGGLPATRRAALVALLFTLAGVGAVLARSEGPGVLGATGAAAGLVTASFDASGAEADSGRPELLLAGEVARRAEERAEGAVAGEGQVVGGDGGDRSGADGTDAVRQRQQKGQQQQQQQQERERARQQVQQEQEQQREGAQPAEVEAEPELPAVPPGTERPAAGWLRGLPFEAQARLQKQWGVSTPQLDDFTQLRGADMATRCVPGQMNEMHRVCAPGVELPEFVSTDAYVGEGTPRLTAALLFERPRQVVILGDSIMLQVFDAMSCEAMRDRHDAMGGDRERVCMPLDLDGVQTRTIRVGRACLHYATIGRFTDPNSGSDAHSRGMLAAAFNSADEVHVNVALHYPLRYNPGQIDGYAVDAEAVFEVMQAQADAGKVAVWWETAAQHFPAEDDSGMYEDWQKSEAKGRCFCMPVSDRSPRHKSTRPLLRSGRFEGIRVMPYFELTQPRFDMHHQIYCANERTTQCCDCTHFCYTVPFWESVFARLHDLTEVEGAT